MKRTFYSLFCLLLGLSIGVNAGTMTEPLSHSQIRGQEKAIEAAYTLALLHQVHPVSDLLQARKIFINQVLESSEPYFETEMLAHSDRILKRVRSEMSWELLSHLPDARLYSLFTAADLGGYGDNEPPYEPGNPSPANGATSVPREVTLEWTGGDPNPGDMLYYDVYFGTEANPPLMASSLTTEAYTVSDMTPGTMYYWKIIARDNWDATTEGQIWQFTTHDNNPPHEPVNPIPPDAGTDIDINVNLSWQCNDPDPGDPLTFDVYFGDNDPPSLAVSGISDYTYDPGELATGTTYYWQIYAIDSFGAETAGPVWSFTTLTVSNNPPNEPSNPSPANSATDVDRDADIRWDGGDPDPGDTVVYDVYMGRDPDPPAVATNLTTTTYDFGTMESGTMYYWYIVARDNHSAETMSPVWSFITVIDGPTPTPPPGTPTPTPTFEPCDHWSIELDMGQSYFCPGDPCYLNATICNPEQSQYLPVWVLLEVEGMFWFAPSWTQDDIAYYLETVPNGWSVKEVLPEFIWPDIEGSYDGCRFWSAITTLEFELLGDYDMITFGWGPCM